MGFSGLHMTTSGYYFPIFHPICWMSNKKRRNSDSPFWAELIAAADKDDRGYNIKLPYRSIFTG